MASAKHDPYLAAALCTAAALGDVAKIESLLLREPTLINSFDYDLRTPLHIAASQGRERIVELLLQHGANVNAEDRWLGTPLQDALRQENESIVGLLRQHGASTGNLDEIIGALLKAAAAGDAGLINKALREGVDINSCDYDGRSALHLAAANGHTEIVRLLVSRGADVNIEDRFGGTPMFDAVRHQHDEVVRLLNAAGARLVENDANIAALCLAAMEGDAALVRRLLDGGANINSGDYDQRTALHLASAEGHAALVSFLIEHGAKINALDRWGTTPLDDAEHHRHATVVAILRAAGASHGIGNQQDDTMLVENRITFKPTRSNEPTESMQDLRRLGIGATVELLKEASCYPAFCLRAVDTLAALLHDLSVTNEKSAPSLAPVAARHEFVEHAGLDLIGNILAACTDDGETKQCCLSILRSIGEQDLYAPEIARIGGVRLSLEATKSLHVETVVHAVNCIANITFPGAADSTRICELLVRENGINGLVEALRHYQEDARIAEKCCSALWNVLQIDTSSLKRVERMTGLAIICDIWKLHEPNASVITAAAGLVAQLMQQNTMKCEFMLERRGAELVIAAIKRHIDNSYAVCACLAVLAALCTPPKGIDVKSDKTLPAILERTKGVALLLDVIRTYPNDVWLLENAAHILHVAMKGVSKPASLASQIRASKGKAMVDNAHKRFPNSEIIADIHSDFHRRGAACTISQLTTSTGRGGGGGVQEPRVLLLPCK